MGLRELVHEYIEDLEILGRAPLTAKHYQANLGLLVEWLVTQTGKAAAELSATDVDEEQLRSYQLFLARRRDPRTGRPVSAATRNLYLTPLRRLLHYARRRRGLALPDPEVAVPRAKERDREIRHLTREEYERLRDAVDLSKLTGIRDRALIEALFGSGARVSELVNMTVRGVDLQRREVQIVGKGGKARIVFLTEEAAGWIGRYLATRSDDCVALFVSAKGEARRLGVRQVERVVEKAATRAALPLKVSPHWLRHSRITIVARHSGVEVAQRVAGHSSLQTTARYLHVTDTHLRALYDQAERADRGTKA